MRRSCFLYELTLTDVHHSGLTFQDVSKKGLKYGDEDEHEAERAELAAQNKAFAPLLKWLKAQFEGMVADGTAVISFLTQSNRLIVLHLYSRPHQPSSVIAMRNRCRLVADSPPASASSAVSLTRYFLVRV